MPWKSPKEIYKRYKLHRDKKKRVKSFQNHDAPSPPAITRKDSKVDPIVEFSRKEIVLRTSTPIKPGPPLKHKEPVVDLWDQVDSQRRRITARNQRESPFLRLPSECRNLIYEHALGGRTYRFKDAVHGSHAAVDTKGEHHILGLLYVCHQIYSEASLFPYSLNTFSFREFEHSLVPFLAHRRLAHTRAITSIELVTYQAARMWAAPDVFAADFRELEETEMFWRLPNLREIKVIVDLNVSLYVVYGTRDFDFRVIRQAQVDLEEVIEKLNPVVLVRFFWA